MEREPALLFPSPRKTLEKNATQQQQQQQPLVVSSVSASGPKAKAAKRQTNAELVELLDRVPVGPIGSFHNTAANKTVCVSLKRLGDSKNGREWSKKYLLPLPAQLTALNATKEMMTGEFKKETLCSAPKRKFDFWKQYGHNGKKSAARTAWEVSVGDFTVGYCLVNDNCACDKNFVFNPDKTDDGKESIHQGRIERTNIVDLVFFRYDTELVGDPRCPDLTMSKVEHKGVFKFALSHIVREILQIQELDGVVGCVLVKNSRAESPEEYRIRADQLLRAAGLRWVKRVRVEGGQVDDRYIALRTWDGMNEPTLVIA